jgi:hypothetical protein
MGLVVANQELVEYESGSRLMLGTCMEVHIFTWDPWNSRAHEDAPTACNAAPCYMTRRSQALAVAN